MRTISCARGPGLRAFEMGGLWHRQMQDLRRVRGLSLLRRDGLQDSAIH